jgi:hypothetical protein
VVSVTAAQRALKKPIQVKRPKKVMAAQEAAKAAATPGNNVLPFAPPPGHNSPQMAGAVAMLRNTQRGVVRRG